MSIILASGSARRRELFEMLKVRDFKIIPAEGQEIPAPGQTPEKQAALIAAAKAREVAALCAEEDVIVAADTIVVTDGEVFGKPYDRKQAAFMLSELSGKTHTVYTGVTVIKGASETTEVEATNVRFRKLDDREIRDYVESGEPDDKAGAYGIQGRGALFVESISGDFFNVMGLPLCRLGLMLKKLGVDLI
ncbi:MAG: Maf family protein [Oscillospiraceae bacterium]|nr:Maf family protein [Oscillospiraceae bacterium]